MGTVNPVAPTRTTAFLTYAAMIVGAVALFFLFRSWGADLVAPAAVEAPPHPGATPRAGANSVFHLLLALATVVAAARLVGNVFRRLGQPPVIGEIIAGIMLGPSLLGRVWPEGSAFLLPAEIAPALALIAQIGVILYMFLVGLELNTALLQKRTHATIAVSHASIIVPFILGSALALWLYPRFSSSDVPFTVFALFMGVAMSVTAFPVLARILTDENMHTTRLGTVALACAAVDDVTAWCLLAMVVGVVHAEPGRVLVTVALTAGYIAAMIFVVRPILLRIVRAREHRTHTQGTFAMVCVALLVSALTTEAIGIHALFGAFFLGAVLPHDSSLAQDVQRKLQDVVVVLLLPVFFAITGMRTEIGLVSGLAAWLACGVIILVASIGKFGGAAAAARLAGFPWREALGLGVLMNTRGLMQLIVLSVGLDLGVLSPALFAMFILMAIATTLMTAPVLHHLIPPESRAVPAAGTPPA
jgi:Kef-type K+ transport system membrane component KefB